MKSDGTAVPHGRRSIITAITVVIIVDGCKLSPNPMKIQRISNLAENLTTAKTVIKFTHLHLTLLITEE